MVFAAGGLSTRVREAPYFGDAKGDVAFFGGEGSGRGDSLRGEDGAGVLVGSKG